MAARALLALAAAACRRPDAAARVTDAIAPPAAAVGRADSLAVHADPARPIVARPGEEFAIVLAADGTSGQEWALADALPPAVLRLLGNRFEQTPTGAAAGARPAAGRERWTFRATAPGEAVVRLRYARPLDPAPATDSARFVVRVR